MTRELIFKELNVALDVSGLSAAELAINLDRLKTLVQRVLIGEAGNLDVEVESILTAEVERLGTMLNPIFRPTDGGPLPLVNSFTGVRIGYWTDERGFVVSALDWVGRPFLRSYACDANMTPLGAGEVWQFDRPPLRPAPLDLEGIKAHAVEIANALAKLWDHPAKEPHVVEDANLEKRLSELLKERDDIAISLAYGDFLG